MTGKFIFRNVNDEGQSGVLSASRARPRPRDPIPIKERFINAKVSAYPLSELRGNPVFLSIKTLVWVLFHHAKKLRQ